jgi:hypothetical protein
MTLSIAFADILGRSKKIKVKLEAWCSSFRGRGALQPVAARKLGGLFR